MLREEEAKILINYPAAREMNKSHPNIPNGFSEVLIDSGGYQLQTGVAEVYLKAYSLWLQLLIPGRPEIVGYFNLDFSDPLDTMNNQFFLESEGLNPIPVWHIGDPMEYLDYYCSNYGWISVGGLVSLDIHAGKDRLTRLLNWIMQSYPNNRFHILGIGISGVKAFRQIRPYSIDFSTWSTTGRFGHAIVLDSKQIVKEVVMTTRDKQKLRDNKKFLFDTTRDAIKNFKKYESDISSLKDTDHQLLFF